MAVNPVLAVQEEPAVSCDTTAPCLALIMQNFGVYFGTDDIRSLMGRSSTAMSISDLVDLVGQIGFSARYLHGDWHWLALAMASRPVLLRLKNTNTIVALGSGREGVEELVVSDPLYDEGSMIVLPRENLERAWDGDAIILGPRQGTSRNAVTRRGLAIADRTSSRRSVSRASTVLLSAIVLCLGAVLFQSARTLPPLVQKLAATLAPVERPTAALPPAPRVIVPTPADPEPAASAAPAPTLAPAANPPPAADNTKPTETASNTAAPPTLYSATATGYPTPLPDPAAALRPATVEQEPATTDKPKLSASDVAALLARGDDFLRTGDIASARLFYERCAEAGDSGSALRLGETFDPVFLDRAHLPVASGDMDKAVFWYRRASDLGSGEAHALLKHLDAR